jgi:hypothetical protein
VHRIIPVIILLFPLLLRGQTYASKHFGASIGMNLRFGTHRNSIGLIFNTYYVQNYFQLNFGNTISYNLKSYGDRKQFIESRTNLGLMLLSGKKNQKPDFQLDGLLHNSNSNYALGYNYVWYNDDTQTSQHSGGWSLHLKNAAILFENDVFGGQGKDRFRSGHLVFSYRNNPWKLIGGIFIWTGETSKTVWQKISFTGCPYGFRSLEETSYGKTSHGLLYGGFSYDIGFGQSLTYRIGADSEEIRHAFQNRLTHDLIFLPSSIKRNTPHYPRLDKNGCPVFEEKEVRDSKFYYQGGVNMNWNE